MGCPYLRAFNYYCIINEKCSFKSIPKCTFVHIFNLIAFQLLVLFKFMHYFSNDLLHSHKEPVD